jgi:WD40 repeat protein
MLYRSNILALVGGGKNPKFTPNKVILWDDYQTKILTEFKFPLSVKNVKLKKDKIFVVCEQKIYVYSMDKYKLIESIDTFINALGTIGVNTEESFTILAYPSNPKGFMKVKYYEKSQELTINVHDSFLTFIVISNDGNLIGVSAEKCPLIRVFSIERGEFIEEFRLSHTYMNISYLVFSPDSKFMGACSDGGIIHIWSLGTCWKIVQEKGIEIDNVNIDIDHLPNNRKSLLSYLPKFLTGGAFDSMKSFAKVKLNDEQSICAFGENNIIIAVSNTGVYYKAKMDPLKGGHCSILQEEEFNIKKKNDLD